MALQTSSAGVRCPVKVGQDVPLARVSGKISTQYAVIMDQTSNGLSLDFGARDATAGEVETNFSEKNLWNWDTEHLIKAPDAIGALVGLGSKNCAETPADPVDEKTRELLRQQVPGWRVVDVAELGAGIRRDWTAQGPAEAKQLGERFQAVASQEGHPVTVTCVASQAFAVLPVEGELSRRDFVLAAKLNSLDVTDLEKKKAAKYWA